MIAIIVICLLAAISTVLTFYLWQRPAVGKPDTELPPPRIAGLFSNHDASTAVGGTDADEVLSIRAHLLDRARAGEVTVLIETRSLADADLYSEVLDALMDRSESREKLRTLVSFISANAELRANKRLAEHVMNTWQAAPDRRSTVEMMHIAALSDDPATYQRAVELVVSFWQNGKLAEFRSEDLIELFESQFWMLAPEARRGGAAFALKQKLADVRRELAMTTPTRP